MRAIEWTKKALRQIRKIKEQHVKNAIYDAVSTLEDFPKCQDIKKLVNKEGYRLRVGDWRVIFTDELAILYIEEVKKRDEKTYK